MSTAQEWAAEFLDTKATKREERKAWETALKHQTYLRQAPDPTTLTGFYAADPDLRKSRYGAPESADPSDIKFYQMAQQKKSEFVETIENAYTTYRGDIPMQFWMELGPTELRTFGGGVYDDLATHLEQVLANQSVETRIREEQNRLWEEALDAQSRSEDFLAEFGVDPENHQTSSELYAAMGNVARGRADLNFEDEIADYMASEREILSWMRKGLPSPTDFWMNKFSDEQLAAMEAEGIDPKDDPKFYLSQGDPLSFEDHKRFWQQEVEFLKGAGVTKLVDLDDDEFEELVSQREALLRSQIAQAPDQIEKLTTPGLGLSFIEGSFAAMGDLMNAGLTVGGLIIDHGGPLTLPAQVTHGALNELFGSSEEQRDATLKQIKAETGLPETDILAQLTNTSAQVAWEELAEANPEVHGEYIRMAGLDPTLAFSFFQADMLAGVEPDEQLRYLEEFDAEQNDMIEHLKDQDFTMGDDVLHWLGVWGRNVPGRLSTMYTIMLTDDDFQRMAKEEGVGGFVDTWKAVNEEAERYGHTPSRALGIDGSFAGLMIDLGGGIAFDPTTWIFGPRAAGGAAKAATQADAVLLARGPMVRQMADDIVKFSQSPSKGVSSMYHAADWLDDVSMGEFLNAVDFNPQALKTTPWRATKGHNAIEVRTDFLLDLISPDELRGLKPQALRGLHDDMVQNGVSEALEISISRGDNSIWISDGVKRAVAADDISHLPVRLRVTDDVAPGKTVIPGVADDTAERLAQWHRGEFETLEGKTAARSTGANESLRESIDNVKAFERQSTETIAVGRTSSGHTLERSVDGGRWYVVDEADELVGFLDATDFASGFALKPGAGGKQTIHEILTTAQGEGFDLIAKMRLDDLSDAGRATLIHHADEMMKQALPSANRAGTKLDDILMEGDELGKPLADPGLGDSLMRPDSVLPRRLLSGDIDYDAVYEIMERAIVERGAVPTGAHRGAIARHWHSKVKDLAKKNGMGRWIERYMSPQAVTTRFELTGVHAIDDIVESAYRLWGDDTAKLDEWLERVMLYQKENTRRNQVTATRLAELSPRQARLAKLHDMVGDVWDDALRDVELPADELAQSVKNRNQLKRLVSEEDAYLNKQLAAIDKEAGVVGRTNDLEQIIMDMWDDYNRTHIAQNPIWKPLADETGLVPWDELKKGMPRKPGAPDLSDATAVLPDDLQKVADDLGVNGEKLAQQLSATQNTLLSTDVPLSPLETMLASQLGASAWTKLTQRAAVSKVREAAFAFNRFWVVDKVFSLATAATVSVDELLRIFHTYGYEATFKWMQDRATFMQAHANSLLYGKGGQRLTKGAGAARLSAKQQERLRHLSDFPNKLKAAERQMLEQHGLGWTDLTPNDMGFRDAAKQWTAGFVQDTGFRAFLRGREAFREWFTSPDGEILRRSAVTKRTEAGMRSTIVQNADDFYDGWQTLFDDVILSGARKAGKYDEVRAAWVDIAKRVDETGGLPKDLPDIAINHLDSVRGVRRDPANKINGTSLQESFFDKLFMDPVNYRRGFLADLTRTHEKSRLTSLMHSQGKRIVSDAEIESIMGLQGIAGANRTGLRSAVHDMAIRAGYMPESYLDDLVEKAVLREIDNTLYSFDSSSRLGAQSKAVFPFGKPWADMAGFWGREAVRAPVLRGWVNKTNAFGLRTLDEKGILAYSPVNKSSALISRLAHTDFTIDKGLIGGEGEGFLHEGGLIPGTESIDFSPLFFLPTAGENPMQYMIPGLGVVPIVFLDKLMESKYDPIEQPEEYQALVDEIAQFIPSAHFQQGSWQSRILGGGTTIKAITAGLDINTMLGGDPNEAVTNWLGDVSRDVDRSRELSALMADPEELELLLSATSEEMAKELFLGLSMQAEDNAASGNLAATAVRWMTPIDADFSDAVHEIQDVWLDGLQHGPLAHLAPDRPIANLTDEQRRQVANDVRSAFFRLEQWERDAAVVTQPSLAVNLVGTWEWTEEARLAGVEGSSRTYRTGGTKADQSRHQSLLEKGYIAPVDPLRRAHRILGVVEKARVNAAKELYDSSVAEVNKVLWETLSDKDRGLMELVIGSEFAKEYDLQSPAEVWANWSRIEEDLEFYLAERFDIDPVRGVSTRKADLTEFDKLRRAIKLETKPWGRTFPGLEEEDVSKKYRDLPGTLMTPKMEQLAESLGIDLSAETSGEELFYELQQQITASDSYAFSIARPVYESYIEERVDQSGRNLLHEAAQSANVTEEFQDAIKTFLFRHDMVQTRHEGSFVPRVDQLRMKEDYLYLMNGAKSQKIAWEQIWESQFARKYGPLEWTPPEPVSPLDEDGNIRGDAFQPYIKSVVDGDTLYVQAYKGAPQLNAVRLLGVDAEEKFGTNSEEAHRQWKDLSDAILQARENGDRIYLVRDDRFGQTDQYGRMLAWLWIGDEPYYFEEHLIPNREPSGGTP